MTRQRTEKSPAEVSDDWFSSVGEETIEEYSTEEEWKILNRIFIRREFTPASKELIWDNLLLRYGLDRPTTQHSFTLINIDDLTELAKQLNEDNWQTKFVKKFTICKMLFIEECFGLRLDA